MLGQELSQGLAVVSDERSSDAPPASAKVDGVELALWMGQLLMDNGAETERVDHAVRSCAAQLGGELDGVVVTYNALLVTRRAEERTQTRVRKVQPKAVNMTLIAHLHQLSQRIARGDVGPEQAAAALERVEKASRHYSPTLTAVATGVACAAFSRLFQGDWEAFAITLVATTSAMWVRHHYGKLRPNRLVFAALSACVAGAITGLLHTHLKLSQTPGAAFVACGLMLVPGVPAINAVQDLIKGRLDVGIARAVEAALVVLAATLGLLLGLSLSLVQP